MDAEVGELTPKVRELLQLAVEKQASDLHLVPGFPIMLRIHGDLHRAGASVLAPADVRRIVDAILPTRLQARLGDEKNFDCSLAVDSGSRTHRFRANVFMAQGNWCACLRHIPQDIPGFEWMGFPEGLAQRLVSHRNGMVIISGVTGSGKSTTLAAMIDVLNRKGGYRIITVEEPIEYVHRPLTSTIVTQREVGRDVDSFYDGLRSGLRQDPDVILIGEIRDRDTAQMALGAAETGHLILTTLHTKDAKGAITRFTDLFPFDSQEDIRTQLSLSLRSVICQHLLPATNPAEKRALAMEILHVNQPIRVAIRFGKIDSIESNIQTGKRDGMQTLDEDLERLALSGRITKETARRFAKDADMFPR